MGGLAVLLGVVWLRSLTAGFMATCRGRSRQRSPHQFPGRRTKSSHSRDATDPDPRRGPTRQPRRVVTGDLPASRLGRRIIRVRVEDLDHIFRPIPTVRPTWRRGA
jgi:hypothetical protein